MKVGCQHPMANSRILTETITKVSSIRVCERAVVGIYTLMALFMRESGKMI
jgi:hypothetical protein